MGAADGSIFTRETARVGGLDVPYLRGGRQERIPPVVYLHGMGGGGKWEAYHMAMGTATLVYAPQLPGWQEGRSPPGVSSVRDYAGLVVELLDSLGVGEAVLAGHSIGGWIALYAAAQHRDRFPRLVLADPMGVGADDAPSPDLEAMDEEAFATAVFGKLGLIATAQAYGFGAEWENVRKGPEFERQWRGRGLVVELAQGRYADPQLSVDVLSMTADTLLIWGRLDGIVPLGVGEALRAALKKSRLDVIDGAGHLPMVEKPETFNRIVRDFLVGREEGIPGVVTI